MSERAVKSTKEILQQKDYYLVLLTYWGTLLPSFRVGLAELGYGCRCRTTLVFFPLGTRSSHNGHWKCAKVWWICQGITEAMSQSACTSRSGDQSNIPYLWEGGRKELEASERCDLGVDADRTLSKLLKQNWDITADIWSYVQLNVWFQE